MQLTVYACILSISWFGAKMIVGQTGLTTGELTSLLSYVMNILMSLMMLSMVFVMVTQSAAAAQRIDEVLEEQPDITSPENAVKTVKDGSVDFSHVTFAYQQRSDKPVLSDIDLHIRSGETIGVMGGAGSSKSSLVSLISRLYDVTAGEVRVGGVDVRKYDVESLRDAVSVVLQTTCSSPARFTITSAGATKTRRTSNAARHAVWPARTNLSSASRKNTTPASSAAARTYPAARSSACASPVRCSKTRRCSFWMTPPAPSIPRRTRRFARPCAPTSPARPRSSSRSAFPSIQDADRVLVLDNGRVNAFDTPENLLKTNAIYQEVYNSQAGSGSGDFDEAAMKGGD